jgi:hypothetical protein
VRAAALGIKGREFWLSTPRHLLPLIDEYDRLEKYNRVNLAESIVHLQNGGSAADLIGGADVINDNDAAVAAFDRFF